MGISADYLDQFTPMERAKVEAALDRQMRLDGRYMWRWEVAEHLAKLPDLRVDRVRRRVYHGDSGHFWALPDITDRCATYAEWLAEQASV